MMTPRQAKRMQEGKFESTPSDYARRSVTRKDAGNATTHIKIDTRRKLEDRKMMHELGLLDS
jgi:hypothetical protein